MAIVVHVQARPAERTTLLTGHLRATATYEPAIRFGDINEFSLKPVYAEDEPTFREYLGQIEGSVEGHVVSDLVRVVVTARRVLLCAWTARANAGEILVAAIDRGDLQTVSEIPARRRRKPSAVLIVAPRVDIRVTPTGNRAAHLVSSLQPGSATEMGAEAHARRQAENRLAEQEQLRAINEHAAESRRKREAQQARTARVPDMSFGLLDHRKIWNYSVMAPVDQCIAAFTSAFAGRGGLVLNGRWDIETNDDGATAVYAGRRGLMGIAAAMTEISQAEEDSAGGTRVRFTVGESPSGKALCTLRLVDRGVRMGLTSDARFIRPHFHAVTTRLRRLDPQLEIHTS